MDVFYLVLFCTVGLFNIVSAIFGFKWYMNYYTAKPGLFYGKPKATRVFLTVTGMALIAFGIVFYTGLI